MRKVKPFFFLLLFALLAVVFLSGTTSVVIAQENDIHYTNQQYSQLSTFLNERGFTAHNREMIRSRIDNLAFDNGVDVEVDMRVQLVPFANEDGSRATIAVWRGTWDRNFYEGAIVTLNETEMYGVVDGTVQKIEAVETYLEIPLYALGGPTPPGSQEFEEAKRTEAISLSTSCTTFHRTTTAYSYLGSKMYTYAMDKYLCFNGSTVSNVNVTTYLEYSDGIHEYVGDSTASDYYKNSHTLHYSFHQAHIKKCVVQWGCIAHLYPWIKLEVNKNGNATIDLSYNGL